MAESPSGLKVVTYAGPNFIMYNKTANCSRAITPPKRNNLVLLWCVDKDLHESSIYRWEDSGRAQLEAEIRMVSGYFQLNCYGKKVIINGTDYACPPWPIQIDQGVTFTFNNITYTQTDFKHEFNSNRKKSNVDIKALNQTLAIDSEYFLNRKYIDEIAAQNREWSGLKFDGKSLPLHRTDGGLDWFGLGNTYSYIIIAISAIFVLVIVIVCICFVQSNARTNGGATGSVHVECTVNNNMPQPSAPLEEESSSISKPQLVEVLLAAMVSLLGPFFNANRARSQDIELDRSAARSLITEDK